MLLLHIVSWGTTCDIIRGSIALAGITPDKANGKITESDNSPNTVLRMARRRNSSQGVYLHTTHHVCIDKRTYKGGDKRCGGDTGCQSEYSMETFLIVPIRGHLSIMSAKAPNITNRKIHCESSPDKESSLSVSPFPHTIIDNVMIPGKNYQSTCKTQRTY